VSKFRSSRSPLQWNETETRAGLAVACPVTLQCRLQVINLMAKRGVYCIRVIVMARFADKLHVDTQKIDRVESAVLLSIIVGGLALCVLGAAISDIGRAFSVW
jgi:hypothetical protein